MDSFAALKDFQSSPLTGRRWQLEAMRKLNKLRRKGQRDFLVVAAPATGKTRTGLEAARVLLNEGEVERIVVVCHSNHLRQQWARAASRVNIRLDAAWSNSDGVESTDYHGVVVTYQQARLHLRLPRSGRGLRLPPDLFLDLRRRSSVDERRRRSPIRAFDAGHS